MTGAQQDGTLAPPSQLPPSIIRSSSLSPNRPLPSPRFDPSASSSHPSSGVHTPLSPSPATKGSILLNKPASNAGSTPASPTMEGQEAAHSASGGQQQWAQGGAALLRSPISLEGQAVGSSEHYSPTSDGGAQDPTSQTLSGAASYFVEQQQASNPGAAGADPRGGRPSRSPSPHCHFAPLPRVEGDRPGTRRNSAAQRGGSVRPFTAGNKETSDDSPFAADSPTNGLAHSTTGVDHHTLASTLSNLSLHRQSSNASSPRVSRSRHASSRSSRSPSPSPSRQDKTAAATSSSARPPLTSGHSSRSHSPAMSRRASTDAMSLHYIEGSRSEGGGRSMSRDRGGAEVGVGGIKNVGDKEKELELERIRMGRDREREGQGWKEEREAALASSRPTSVEPSAGAHSPGGSRTASPAIGATGERRPMFVEPTRPSLGGRKRSNEEVVEIEPGEEKGGPEEDLEDLAEEPEEENGTGEDEDDDEDDEDEDDDEGERSREDDDDDEDEVEEEPRATSRGAAVEVVHWHRSESPEREREKELARESAQ